MRAIGWKLAIGFLGLILGQSAGAVTTIGSFTFADDAFADTVILSSGGLDGSNPVSFTTFPDASASLESVLTDASENTGAFSTGLGAFVQLGFDNAVLNGVDEDLVLFETGTGSVDRVMVTLGFGPTFIKNEYSFSPVAGVSGLNAAVIDLDDFGVASIDSLIIEMDLESTLMTVPSLTLVGALHTSVNPVPVPAAVWMFGSGLIGLVGIARRRRA